MDSHIYRFSSIGIAVVCDMRGVRYYKIDENAKDFHTFECELDASYAEPLVKEALLKRQKEQ